MKRSPGQLNKRLFSLTFTELNGYFLFYYGRLSSAHQSQRRRGHTWRVDMSPGKTQNLKCMFKSPLLSMGYNFCVYTRPPTRTGIKTQHGRIPINSVILAAIGHRFRKLQMQTCGRRRRAETRNWRLFLLGLMT